MELGQITLESVLIIVIALITLNLLFIGFYILSVLRELKKTLTRARGMMEEVDRSVKTGMDKFIAIERPLEALSTTTNALAGFIKGADMIKKTTQSILNGGGSTNTNEDASVTATTTTKVTVEEAELESKEIKDDVEPEAEKKPKKKPKFFSR